MRELQIMNIKGIDCYEKDGTAYLKLETVARGLGFTRTANSGNEVVRWETVRKYLSELGVPTSWHGDSQPVGKEGLPEYIPENIFYRLAMKAKNAVAEAFQATIADEVIPSIRKHGLYATEDTVEAMLNDPDMAIRLLQEVKKEREKRKELETANASLVEQVNVQQQQIAEMQPKASYYDVVLNCKDLVAISTIAKDYGWSANRMNTYLHEKGVQYKQGSIWLLYQKHAEQGYTSTKTHSYPGSDGTVHSKTHTYWTQKGRLFIYALLKSDRILPLIEKGEAA